MGLKKAAKPDLAVKAFATAEKWNAWLLKNHARQAGIWLKLFTKNSGKKTLSHAEALDEALCFGWIDGQGKAFDDHAWLVKFTPRRPRSIWSKKNCENIDRLIKERRMQPSGLAQVRQAKADGRWEAAYDSSKTMEIPEDFLRRLKKDKNAYTFFQTLNRANTYAIAWRLQTAKKPETREARMDKLLNMMKNKIKLH